MKKSKSVILIITPILSTVLFNACGSRSSYSSYESTTRDVYQSRDECLKDWGDGELCQEMDDNDSNEYRRTGGVYAGRPFYGPQYYPSDRSVIYKGKTVSPTTKSTSLKSFTSSSSSRSSVSTPRSSSSSYGGFGGRSSSGGGSSS